jgi:hypothetical protein
MASETVVFLPSVASHTKKIQLPDCDGIKKAEERQAWLGRNRSGSIEDDGPANSYTTIRLRDKQIPRKTRPPQAIAGSSRSNIVPPANEELSRATWTGGWMLSSFPPQYAAQRLRWQRAGEAADWVDMVSFLDQQPASRRQEWFNLQDVVTSEDNEVSCPWAGYTALHLMAFHGPPREQNAQWYAWNVLLEEVAKGGAWSQYTPRSLRNGTDEYRINTYAPLREKSLPGRPGLRS